MTKNWKLPGAPPPGPPPGAWPSDSICLRLGNKPHNLNFAENVYILVYAPRQNFFRCPGCNPPPIFFFFKQRFLPNKLPKTLLYNCFYIFFASFDVYEVKFGDVVWEWWGASKVMVGGWWNPKIFSLSMIHFIDILQNIMLQTCYVDENHHFLA